MRPSPGALTVEAAGIAGVPTAERLAGRWRASSRAESSRRALGSAAAAVRRVPRLGTRMA